MWGKLIGALVAYLVADKVTHVATGKHIHDHVFAWWRRFTDSVSKWLIENKDPLGISSCAIFVLDKADNIACAAKQALNRVKLRAVGKDSHGKHYLIAEENDVEISEILQKYPDLRATGVYEYQV